MDRWYISLNALKIDIGETGTTNDAKLKRYIDRASAAIEQMTGKQFIPSTETRYFDVPRESAQVLMVDKWLLSITALSDDDGAITSDEYWLYPLNYSPKHSIVLDGDARSWVYDDDPNKVITVTGQWGWSNDTANTGITLGAAIATATTTSVTASGAGVEVGWVVLIDDEQMLVTAVSVAALTVKRGVNGTTAATHDNGTAIYRYVVPADIEQACAILASSYNSTTSQAGVSSIKIGEYSETFGAGSAVETVKDLLSGYMSFV